MCKGCYGDTPRTLEAATKPGEEPDDRVRQKEIIDLNNGLS